MRLIRRLWPLLVAFFSCCGPPALVAAAPNATVEKPAADAKAGEQAAAAVVEKPAAVDVKAGEKVLAAALAAAAVEPPAVAPMVEQEFEVLEGKETPLQEAADEARGAALAAQPDKDEKASATNDAPLVREWDKHMEGFVPELLLTFPLPARTDEYFYEDVGRDPVLVRGGFFASSEDETSSVDFQILDPSGDVVFEKNAEAEGLFHFITKKNGTYTFVVSNNKWMEQKVITFTMGKGNETHLQTEHLDGIDAHVKSIDRTLKDIQTESTYLWIRQKSHMKSVESIHRRVFWFCVIEFLILIGVSGFQVYYIKGLLSDRRVL